MTKTTVIFNDAGQRVSFYPDSINSNTFCIQIKTQYGYAIRRFNFNQTAELMLSVAEAAGWSDPSPDNTTATGIVKDLRRIVEISRQKSHEESVTKRRDELALKLTSGGSNFYNLSGATQRAIDLIIELQDAPEK